MAHSRFWLQFGSCLMLITFCSCEWDTNGEGGYLSLFNACRLMVSVNYALQPNPDQDEQKINLCELFNKLDDGNQWVRNNEIQSHPLAKNPADKENQNQTAERKSIKVEFSTMKNFLSAFDEIYKKYNEAAMELLHKGWKISTLTHELIFLNSQLRSITEQFRRCPEFDESSARDTIVRAEHSSMRMKAWIAAAWQKLLVRQQKIMSHQHE